MNVIDLIIDIEDYCDKIVMVDDLGKCVWIYLKKFKGCFINVCIYLSWVLFVFLFGMLFIKVNGDLLLFFNILEWKFIFFGIQFMLQDFYLFVLAMLMFIVFIVFFIVVWGRFFCGWVCLQIIFMEMVFWKIEYVIEGDVNVQKRFDNVFWMIQKIIKKVSKQAIFFVIFVFVANIFLVYIIGVDEVIQIVIELVLQNFLGFIVMILFFGVFYFVFFYLCEQVCVIICFYGCFQGVMLDQNFIVVVYDFVCGEFRGKLKRGKKNNLVFVFGNVGVYNFIV